MVVLGSRPNESLQLSVFLMLGGSIVAAFYDFSYDSEGYILVMVNLPCFHGFEWGVDEKGHCFF